MEPFYIQNVTIDGLFGTRKIVWDLRKDVNILGGPNGSGKSIILRACYELLANGVIDDFRCCNTIKSIKMLFTNGWVLSWQVYSNDEAKLQKENLIIPVNTKYFQAYKLTDNEGNDLNKSVNGLEGLRVKYINSFEQRIADAIRLSKLPNDNRSEDSTLLDELIEKEWNIRNDIYVREYASFLEGIRKGEKSGFNVESYEEFFKFFDACRRFFSDYNGITVNNDLKFVRNNVTIPYTALSMGEKQLLLILLMVTNTQSQPAIFIMDEPDLGMHVDWKKKLLKEIHNLNPYIQLIVSTHAPSMVTGWYDCVKEISQITLAGED